MRQPQRAVRASELHSKAGSALPTARHANCDSRSQQTCDGISQQTCDGLSQHSPVCAQNLRFRALQASRCMAASGERRVGASKAHIVFRGGERWTMKRNHKDSETFRIRKYDLGTHADQTSPRKYFLMRLARAPLGCWLEGRWSGTRATRAFENYMLHVVPDPTCHMCSCSSGMLYVG